MICALRRLFVLCSLATLCFTTSVRAEQAAPILGYPGTPSGYPTPSRLYGVSITTREATRLRALEADLQLLAARSDGRIVDGSLSVALGAAFITIGAFVDDALVRTLLWLTGSVATSRGIIELTVLPDAEKPALEFVRMPMLNAVQVVARLAYGEGALARIAHRTRTARLIDGSIGMLAGAAYVPIYALARNRDDRAWKFGDDAADYIVAAFSGISFAAGLVSVIVKSDAERRLAAYGKLRDRLVAEERAATSLRWPALVPYATRDGAGLAASLRF